MTGQAVLELGTAMCDPAAEVMLSMAVGTVLHTRHSAEPLYMFSQIPPAPSAAPLHTECPWYRGLDQNGHSGNNGNHKSDVVVLGSPSA